MRCLIVDDEINIRNSYKILGHWENLGIDEVLEASNGENGLDVVRQAHPDIILTDMNMNTLDGVAFLRCLDDMDYRPQIIVCSGYTDFDYVHSALIHRAVDYLLKPVSETHLNLALEKAVRQIQQSQLNESLNASSDRVSRLSFARLRVVQEFSGRHRFFSLCMPLILNFEEAMQDSNFIQPDLVCLRIQQILESALRKHLNADFLMLHFHDDVKWGFVVIIGGDDGHDMPSETMLRRSIEIAQNHLTLLKLRILWGCSQSFFLWEEFDRRFRALKDGLYLIPIRTQESIRFIRTAEGQEGSVPPVPLPQKGEIIKAIYAGRQAEACGIIHDCCMKVYNAPDYCAAQVMQLGMQIQDILRQSISRSDSASEIIYHLNQSWDALGDNLDNPQRWEEILCNSVNYIASRIVADLPQGLMREILEYIGQNYASHLTLSDLSEQFHMSQEYLSRLISKETGRTFVEHLTECRLHNAIRLLRTTEMSITEIAVKVGFSNASYMSRVFQKVYQIVPTSLRNSKNDDG